MPRENAVDMARFPSTRWSLVGRAGHISGEQRREMLGILLDRYIPALRAHLVLAKGISPNDADDLLQGFVADKIIEQNLLLQAQQSRGRFRSFLLIALDRYVIGRYRHANTQKRSPSTPMLDIADQLDVSGGASEPSWQFTLVWAREIIAEATRRMEARCAQIDRPKLWKIFNERILRPSANNSDPSAHGRLALDLKLGSSKAASNLLVTAKRLFARMLRRVVAEYAGSDRAIDEEIADLKRILSRH